MAEMVLGSNGVRASMGTKFFMDGSSALEIQAGAPIGLSAVGACVLVVMADDI
jgi:hypothetical protein